jgi:hypothetical protein
VFVLQMDTEILMRIFIRALRIHKSSSLDVISENGLLSTFKERAHKIVTNTEGIGWEFHDYLEDLYCQHYE